MLQQTLFNLRQQEPFPNSAVAVLVAPALSSVRFEKERHWGKGVFKVLWQKENKYEFVASQITDNWTDYEKFIALPTLSHLLAIEEETQARVVPDITYEEFRHVILSKQYKSVFLVAHHIQNDILDAIEFSDGAIPLSKIKEFLLQQNDSEHKVNLLLFVCNASDLKESIYNTSSYIQSIASASWKVPLHEGAQFIYHWVSCIDGYSTLTDAYHKAIDKFINK